MIYRLDSGTDGRYETVRNVFLTWNLYTHIHVKYLYVYTRIRIFFSLFYRCTKIIVRREMVNNKICLSVCVLCKMLCAFRWVMFRKDIRCPHVYIRNRCTLCVCMDHLHLSFCRDVVSSKYSGVFGDADGFIFYYLFDFLLLLILLCPYLLIFFLLLFISFKTDSFFILLIKWGVTDVIKAINLLKIVRELLPVSKKILQHYLIMIY